MVPTAVSCPVYCRSVLRPGDWTRLDHLRPISQQSRKRPLNTLGRVSETGPTWGFVSLRRTADFLGQSATGGSREDLRDCCDTRVVVLAAVSTQSRSPAAQDLDSVLRSALVIGSRHGIGLFAVCNRWEGRDLHPTERVSPNTRDLQAPDRESTD